MLRIFLTLHLLLTFQGVLMSQTCYSKYLFSIHALAKSSHQPIHPIPSEPAAGLIPNTYYILANGFSVAPTGKSNVSNNNIIQFNAVLAPNPVKDFTRLLLKLQQTENVDIKILDALGQVVESRVFAQVPAGLQSLELQTDRINPGNYLMQIKTSAGTQSIGFVKIE